MELIVVLSVCVCWLLHAVKTVIVAIVRILFIDCFIEIFIERKQLIFSEIGDLSSGD
jgi:hypothetical protein